LMFFRNATRGCARLHVLRRRNIRYRRFTTAVLTASNLPLSQIGPSENCTVIPTIPHGLTPCSHGLERRNGVERRLVAHRREEFRFEPTKADRRGGMERRKKAAGAWNHMRVR
jgi:hypothetical protein